MRSLQLTQARVALSILLAGLLLETILGAPAARGSFPGRNGQLAVTYGFKCPGSRVAALDARTGRLHMLTPSNCDGWGKIERASWSPDGKQLVFRYDLPLGVASNAEWSRIAIMNADGSGRDDVPFAPAPTVINAPYQDAVASFYRWDASFTPDGAGLIYTRSPGAATDVEIWSAALDGTDDRRIGAGLLARIAPDGRRIAYVQPPHRTDSYNTAPGDTWLMSARTGRPIRRLWTGSVHSLDWSPDGRHIVFTASPQGPFRPSDVYIVRANGTGLHRVTLTRRRFERDVVWSPDGRRIAFVREFRRPLADGESITQSIWTMRPDGTAQRRISGPWMGSDEDGKGLMQISWQPLPTP